MLGGIEFGVERPDRSLRPRERSGSRDTRPRARGAGRRKTSRQTISAAWKPEIASGAARERERPAATRRVLGLLPAVGRVSRSTLSETALRLRETSRARHSQSLRSPRRFRGIPCIRAHGLAQRRIVRRAAIHQAASRIRCNPSYSSGCSWLSILAARTAAGGPAFFPRFLANRLME